jgi:hypothetical protein
VDEQDDAYDEGGHSDQARRQLLALFEPGVPGLQDARRRASKRRSRRSAAVPAFARKGHVHVLSQARGVLDEGERLREGVWIGVL